MLGLLLSLAVAVDVPTPPPGELDVGIAVELPDACVATSAQDMRARVATLLRGGQHVPAQSAVVAIRRADEGPGFAMHVWLIDGARVTERRLVDRDCDALVRAAIYMIALALDPTVRGDSGEATAAADALDKPTSPARESPPIRPRRASLRTFAGVGRGPLGGPSGSVGATLHFGRGAWALGVGARHQFRDALDVPRSPAAAELSWTGGELWACGLRVRGRVAAELCGGIDLGGLRGRADSLLDARPRVLLSGHALARPGLSIALGNGLGWWIGMDVGVAVIRPRFTVDGVETFHRAGLVSVSGLTGLQWEWPDRASLRERDRRVPGNSTPGGVRAGEL